MKQTFIQKMQILWKEFLPLSVSDVTMAFGDPMVNATIAQLPRIQTNLSALGVIKAIIVLFESPIIMILHASNRLSTQEDSRKALLKFIFLACAVLTGALLILSLPFVFFPVMGHLGFSAEITRNAHTMLLCLILWPASIAIRRYFQGILIIHKQLTIIARAGFLRIFVLISCLSIGYFLHIKATYLAAGSMMIGVLAETLAVYFAAQKLSFSHRIEDKPYAKESSHPKSIKEVWKFYWPLANSMVCVWSGRALLVVCLAHSVDSALALAVWPATWALVVVFANSTRMVQQVIIRNQNTFHPAEFIIFAFSVGFTLSIFLAALSITTVGQNILTYFVGTDSNLLRNVKNVLMICTSIPILVAVQNVLQGFLMSLGNTKAINRATLWGVFTLLTCATLGVTQNFLGAQVAAYSMVLSLISENLLLSKQIPWKLYVSQYLNHLKV